MTLGEYITSKLGKMWVVAPRLSPRLKRDGYTVALTPKRYRELELAWAAENPADVLAAMLRSDLALLRAAGLLREPGQP